MGHAKRVKANNTSQQKLRAYMKKVIFIQALTGVYKQGPSLHWLEALLAGEHQA